MADKQAYPKRSVMRLPLSWPFRKALFLLFVLVNSLTLGCMSQASYQPDPQRFAEWGLPQAQKRLEEILLRSINPPINAIEVNEAFIRADLAGTTYQVRVFFRDVKKAEVFTNDLVALRDAADRILFRPVLANGEDARAFADLMLAMAARQSG